MQSHCAKLVASKGNSSLIGLKTRNWIKITGSSKLALIQFGYSQCVFSLALDPEYICLIDSYKLEVEVASTHATLSNLPYDNRVSRVKCPVKLSCLSLTDELIMFIQITRGQCRCVNWSSSNTLIETDPCKLVLKQQRIEEETWWRQAPGARGRRALYECKQNTKQTAGDTPDTGITKG